MATLGDHGSAVPSLVLRRDDGEWLVGEAAARRAIDEPDRVARDTKRRVGDPVPMVVGGTPLAAELVLARLLRWTVDRIATTEGVWPVSVAVTHPAAWGSFKLDLLRSAAASVGVDVARWIPEPVAAATAYAAERPLPDGASMAVYDLGGGTFDACVVRRDAGGFSIVGVPEGIERLGGIDVDEAVLAHVRRAVGGAIDDLQPDDPSDRRAIAALRRECTGAKEALSSDRDTSVPVLLPNLQTSVRLTRAELEEMVRPVLDHTIAVLHRAIASAGIGPDQLHGVLLVGGASRMPLVAEMVSSAVGRPVAVDAHPKDVVALGAARLARDLAGVPPMASSGAEPVVPLAATPTSSRRWWPVAAAAAAAAAVIALAVALRDDDDPDEVTSAVTTTETTTASTTTGDGEDLFAGIDDYGPEAEAAFVEQCAALSGDAEPMCRCAYERWEDEDLPFDEFVDIMTSDVSEGLDPRVQQFVFECTGAGG